MTLFDFGGKFIFLIISTLTFSYITEAFPEVPNPREFALCGFKDDCAAFQCVKNNNSVMTGYGCSSDLKEICGYSNDAEWNPNSEDTKFYSKQFGFFGFGFTSEEARSHMVNEVCFSNT